MKITVTRISKLFLLFALALTVSCSTNKSSTTDTSKTKYLESPTNKVVYGPRGEIIKHEVVALPVEETEGVNSSLDAPDTDSDNEEQRAYRATSQKSKGKQQIKEKKNFTLSENTALSKEARKINWNSDKQQTVDSASQSSETNADDRTLLYIILILLVPFGTTISMYLYEGSEWTSRVTLNLILTLLCGLPGVIHALIVILGKK